MKFSIFGHFEGRFWRCSRRQKWTIVASFDRSHRDLSNETTIVQIGRREHLQKRPSKSQNFRNVLPPVKIWHFFCLRHNSKTRQRICSILSPLDRSRRDLSNEHRMTLWGWILEAVELKQKWPNFGKFVKKIFKNFPIFFFHSVKLKKCREMTKKKCVFWRFLDPKNHFPGP